MFRRLAVSLLFGLTAVGSPLLAAEHTVKMRNNGADGMMVFEPAFLKVAPGDTVIFESTDPGHNSASHYVPQGAKTWDGAMGQTVSVKLDTPGVYVYKCTPHVMLGMIGVIQVGEAQNLAEAKGAAETFKASIAMNKERLDKYLGQVK
ncbi:MAG TPA: pseudoazurin [Gammaproteobacteria bacterium]|nr:pseudoazurin [Gammaproteobacteria bacterium]